MKIAIAQINPIVGDLAGNGKKILSRLNEAVRQSCDLVVFPELALTGYPPEDLLLKPAFVSDNLAVLEQLAKAAPPVAFVVGFVDRIKSDRFNAAAWVEENRVRSIYHKQHLPNYGVFDEIRYFTPGTRFQVVTHKGRRIVLAICEDMWVDEKGLLNLKKLKPDLVISISASPYHAGKLAQRRHVIKKAARFIGAPVLYANLVGGQDELVFDGGSFICEPRGTVRAQCPLFEEGLFVVDILCASKKTARPSFKPSPALSSIEEIYRALVLGTRDYAGKNGFEKAAVGLSGGIDSALVAAIAVEALGKDRVIGVTMPSRYNQAETVQDAERLARNLGIEFLKIPIQPIFEVTLQTLAPHFSGTSPNIAEENLQARIRGNLMMALSNKFGWLVLTTGNKSEVSTGFCTLYGDTAGGFAVLKDVLKTTVYHLSRFANQKAGSDVIPTSTLTRPPTAELKENQKDEDVLGPYADLDPLIVGVVENNMTKDDLIKKYPAKKTYIDRVLSLIDKSEYKRRQAPPGIKITPRSFGRDHRMPITNRYRPY